ncbi:DUF397 domain-containing protein [Micromonospora zhanjiangensis]|uniref:DUF397 domain-containing protein n=1 Tax=Micromonospora zhanjiangensis TaxID=1522057 RepID=A0ABV8KLA5_9ACTN
MSGSRSEQFTNWRRSTRSGNEGNCVEVAESIPAVGVRDSKDPGGPVLTFERHAFGAFVGAVKAGDLRR